MTKLLSKSEPALFQKDAANKRRPAPATETRKLRHMGKAVRITAVSVQNKAWCGNTSHPHSRSTNVATSLRLRRRLSKICQREIALSGFGTILPNDCGTFGKSHRIICQSPRTQRCF